MSHPHDGDPYDGDPVDDAREATETLGTTGDADTDTADETEKIATTGAGDPGDPRSHRQDTEVLPRRSAPTEEAAGSTRERTTSSAPSAPEPGPADDREPRRGPRLFSMLVGIACLAVAGFVLASELGGFALEWAVGGPWLVIGAGLVLAALGVVGALGSRRR